MKISQFKKFTANLGNFESYSFGAEVTVDTDEYPGSTPEQLSEICGRLLEDQLVDSVHEATELTSDKKSKFYGATIVPTTHTSQNGEAVHA